MATSIVAITAAILLSLWLLRAAYVALWLRRPLDFPFGFNPDRTCPQVGTSCGILSGFVLTWLTVGAATAIFLLLRLRAVTKPYKARAIRKPSELVPTAGSIVGEIVGRDEICEVIIDDLRNSADRRPHILLGGVGAGKTAVIVQLTRILATRRAVPVPVRLRDADKGVLDFQGLARKQFLSEIEESVLSQGEAERAWRYLRSTTASSVLADGMEEALSDEGADDDREAMVRVGIRRARRDKLPLVIASRPHDTLRGSDAAIFSLTHRACPPDTAGGCVRWRSSAPRVRIIHARSPTTVPHPCGTVARVDTSATVDRILALLEAPSEATVNTSMRLPTALRDAAALAVDELGVAPSTTTLTATALRAAIETAVMDAALRDHYRAHPDARPELAEVARALAAQDGSPLADRPDLLEQAAAEVTERHPDADADDVLLWAEAQQSVLERRSA